MRALPPWLALAPAVGWMALIFALSAQSHPPQPAPIEGLPFIDKVEHLIEYGILGALLFLGLHRARLPSPAWPVWKVAKLAFVIAILYAASDEFHQSAVPFRQADGADFVVDAVGAFLFAFILAFVVSKRAAPRADVPPPEEKRVV